MPCGIANLKQSNARANAKILVKKEPRHLNLVGARRAVKP
jgi:hypothetical protein